MMHHTISENSEEPHDKDKGKKSIFALGIITLGFTIH